MSSKSRVKGGLGVWLVIVLFWGLALCAPNSLLAKEDEGQIERLAGEDRYQTMRLIAQKVNSGTAFNVILASGTGFSDALAGVPLAHQKKAPILLVGATPAQSTEAFTYIKEHLHENGQVYILGGTGVVSQEFVPALEALGIKKENIHRLGGANRYQTALAIAKALEHDGTTFYFASGEQFPDALSASVLAATTNYVTDRQANYYRAQGIEVSANRGGVPVLLLPSNGEVPDGILEYINSFEIDVPKSLTVVGGTEVIPEPAVSTLETKVLNLSPEGVQRISGTDRYHTMKRLNQGAFDASWDANGTENVVPNIYLASGERFPDALTGAVLAAQNAAPMVLTRNPMPQATQELLLEYYELNAAQESQRTRITVLGGPELITQETVLKADYAFNQGLTGEGEGFVSQFSGGLSLPYDGALGADGVLYVSDTKNHLIRAIDQAGRVTTYAGFSATKDDYGLSIGGYVNGPRLTAMFNEPKGLAIDNAGNLYVADFGNGAIRIISVEGTVRTLVEGLKGPTDVVLGPDGTVYVSETLAHRTIKVSSEGMSAVLAGGGYQTEGGWLIGGYKDGVGQEAMFNEPTGLALAEDGTLYVSDSGNQRLRMIYPDGTVMTIAGSGQQNISGTSYIQGDFQDGPALEAAFNSPQGLYLGEGVLYVADSLNHSIRVLELSSKEADQGVSGQVRTLSGNSNHGLVNGYLQQARFNTPTAVIVKDERTLLIIDQLNNMVRLLEL